MKEYRVNRLATDYRAEVVAALLLEPDGGRLEKLLLRRNPSLARPHTKDIAALRLEKGYDEAERWVLETYREGLYEMLPENLFHEPTLGTPHSTEAEIVAQIRQHRSEEAQARSFFGPFEQEVSYLNILMYALEMRLCQTDSDDLIAVFKSAWPFLGAIAPEAARVFIHILPFLHEVKGDYRWVEKYISLFTGVPVVIREYPAVLAPLAPADCYTLGEQLLGETMLLYGAAGSGETALEICIGPVPDAGMARYLPGAAFNRVLEALYKHFLPFHKAYTQKVIPADTGAALLLGAESHNILGYTAYL